MAYLNPTKLSCTSCKFSAQIKIVVGVGPGSRRGDIPSRYFMDPDPFIKGKDDQGRSSLYCPSCGTWVWTNQAAASARGPLTEQEMRTITGARWLVPGTENPFPPKKRPPNPNDPFSGGEYYPSRPRPVKPG